MSTTKRVRGQEISVGDGRLPLMLGIETTIDLSTAATAASPNVKASVPFACTIVGAWVQVNEVPTVDVTLDIGDSADADEYLAAYTIDATGVFWVDASQFEVTDIAAGATVQFSHGGENSANADGEAIVTLVLDPA